MEARSSASYTTSSLVRRISASMSSTVARRKRNDAKSEVITVAISPLIDSETSEAVQWHLKSRKPKVMPSRVVSGPTLLTSICFCDKCGSAMTLRTGKYGQYLYYIYSIKARQTETGCTGMIAPVDKLDTLITDHLESHILQSGCLKRILHIVLDRW